MLGAIMRGMTHSLESAGRAREVLAGSELWQIRKAVSHRHHATGAQQGTNASTAPTDTDGGGPDADIDGDGGGIVQDILDWLSELF
jgi:hypothetical protein